MLEVLPFLMMALACPLAAGLLVLGLVVLFLRATANKHLPVGTRIGVGLPVLKGRLGERRVRQILVRCQAEGSRILGDVTLRLPDGGTTQIDHLFLSPAGCFCIETKNIDGWIFGTATQRQWTVVNFRRKDRFQNPLHQNYAHIKALESVVGIEPDAIHGAVVFASGAEFKKGRPQGVFLLGELGAWINAPRPAIWSPTRITEVAERIESIRQPVGIVTDWKHVHALRLRHGVPGPVAPPKAATVGLTAMPDAQPARSPATGKQPPPSPVDPRVPPPG